MEKTTENLVDIGGVKLFAKVEGNSTPAVVIETGGGACSSEWILVQKELSKHTTVISYDRAGYAQSSTSNKKRTSKQIATELKSLLKELAIPVPIVLVGASAGGLYVQYFAKLFPEMVAAVVLVDSFTTRALEISLIDAPIYNKSLSLPTIIEGLKVMTTLDDQTFKEHIIPFVSVLYGDTPKIMRSDLLKYYSERKIYKAAVKEYEQLEKNIEEIKAMSTFPQVPLKVIIRDPKKAISLSESFGIPKSEMKKVEKLHYSESEELLSLSEKSELIIFKGSFGSIHINFSKELVSEILDIIEKVKNLK